MPSYSCTAVAMMHCCWCRWTNTVAKVSSIVMTTRCSLATASTTVTMWSDAEDPWSDWQHYLGNSRLLVVSPAVIVLLYTPPFVSVFVFPHDISKTYAAGIIKLDVEMLHDESGKPIYFGFKRSKVKVTSQLSWVVALLWVLASSSLDNYHSLRSRDVADRVKYNCLIGAIRL